MPVTDLAEIAGLTDVLGAKADAASLPAMVASAVATGMASAGTLGLADLTWNNLTGKPSTFTPAAHTQAISTVTGLQAALDAKQASGAYLVAADLTWASVSGKPASFTPSAHSHAIADVTGLQAAIDGKQAAGTYLTVFGNVAGSGGTATQATNKTTAVTLNKATGEITMNAAALAAGAIASFTLNNSVLVAGDQLVATHHAAGTFGPYLINARVTGNGTGQIAVRNTSAASLAEAIVIKFTVVKAVNA